MFKKIILLMLFVFSGYLVWRLITQAEVGPLQQVLKAQNILNQQIPFEENQNQLVIIHFWASWCPPCIHETPALINFVKKSSGKYFLITISEDDNIKDVKSFIKLYPDLLALSSQIILDEGKNLSKLFQVEKLPETFIYSTALRNKENKGVIKNNRVQLSGSVNWDDPQVEQEFLKNL